MRHRHLGDRIYRRRIRTDTQPAAASPSAVSLAISAARAFALGSAHFATVIAVAYGATVASQTEGACASDPATFATNAYRATATPDSALKTVRSDFTCRFFSE